MALWRRLFGGPARAAQPFRLMPAPPAPAAPKAAPTAPRLVRPGEAFTPTQPRAGRRRLVGRRSELQRVLLALREDRAHVVLYAERGRGKTSLSNLVIEELRREGTVVARHTCEAGSTFDTVMAGLMRDLPPALLAGDEAGEQAGGVGCEQALPAQSLRPRDVLGVMGRLTCRTLVCVIDEFDRVRDADTRVRLADTIKQLSDRDTKLLFLVVGVSETLDQILGHHPSIQRSVVGVHLPLFTDRDIAEIIERGARESGFGIPAGIVGGVVVLSRGMPTTAQLLGLRLVQAATERGSDTVAEQDFDAAVERMIEDANPRVAMLYAALTDHGRDAAMARALRRVATGAQDGWGRLLVTPNRDGSLDVGGRTVPAACWERLTDVPVLQPSGPGSALYSVTDRALMQHVLLLAARDLVPLDPGPGSIAMPGRRQAATLDGRSEWMD